MLEILVERAFKKKQILVERAYGRPDRLWTSTSPPEAQPAATISDTHFRIDPLRTRAEHKS